MPDHDTVMYTLAGIANRELGWGLDGETFAAAEMLERYGEETWFRLGDRDLATHIARTARLRSGERLTDVCRALQRSLGVAATILPMTDDAVRTEVRDRRRLARLPGLLRGPPPGARGPRGPVPRASRRPTRRTTCTRRARRRRPRRHRPVEPDRLDRPDPRGPRRPRRRSARRGCAGRASWPCPGSSAARR